MRKGLPLEAEERTLRELLQLFEFKVPDYQRRYAWDDDQVQDLWDDVRDAAGDGHFHFFGTILTNAPERMQHPKRKELLDGQQRLTTFHLLLIAVDRHLERFGGDDASEGVKRRVHSLRDDLAKMMWVDEKRQMKRLELRSGDDVVLSRLLSGVSGEGQDRLGSAFAALHGFLAEYVDQATDPVGALEKLLEAILDRGILIHADAESSFDPFIVFSTLNARGLELKAHEILRARNLGLSKEFGGMAEEEAKRAWSALEAASDEADRFLLSYLVMRLGERVQSKEIVRKFEQHLTREFRSDADPAGRFIDLHRELHDCFSIYDEIRRGRSPVQMKHGAEDKAGSARVHYLVRDLRLRQLTPLLVAIAYRSHEIFEEAFYILERASFLALIYFNNQTRWGNKLFQLANEAYEGRLDIPSLRRSIREFFNEHGGPTICDELPDILKVRLMYRSNTKNLLRFFFIMLQDYGYPGQPQQRPGREVAVILRKLHIDHIAAQRGDHGIPESELHRLGNLTPLQRECNIEAGNASFKVKKEKCYRDSWWAMSRELVELEDWGLKQLEAREDKMVTWATRLLCADLEEPGD